MSFLPKFKIIVVGLNIFLISLVGFQSVGAKHVKGQYLLPISLCRIPKFRS